MPVKWNKPKPVIFEMVRFENFYKKKSKKKTP